MKAVLLCLLVGFAVPVSAQYSARTLTRKVAPQPQPAGPQPARPSAPPVRYAPAPQAPADPTKVAAEKSKTEKNLIEFQKKRAEAGSDYAQYELAMRYFTGNGVAKDEKLGMEWLEKAAKNGHVAAGKKLAELKAAKSKAEQKIEVIKAAE